VLGDIDTNALKLSMAPATAKEPKLSQSNTGVRLWSDTAKWMLPAQLMAGLASLGIKLPSKGTAK